MIYRALRKQDDFFAIFDRLATLSTRTVTELRGLFDSFPVEESDAEEMTEMEAEGDAAHRGVYPPSWRSAA